MNKNTYKEDYKAIEDKIQFSEELTQVIKDLYVECI